MRGPSQAGLREARRQRTTLRLAFAFAATIAMLVLAGPAWSAPGLVASYSFEENSGNVAGDASANGHSGSIFNGTWVPGHTGSALGFNGTNAYVDLGGLGTFYQSGFTLEAWVNKTSAGKNDVAVVGSWAGGQGGPMIWVDHLVTRYQLTLGGGLSTYLDSGQNPVAGQWQYISATYDGSTAHFYVNGVQVAQSTFTGSVGSSNTWRIGAYGTGPGGFFDGTIDDVRIYNRALTPGEVQTDMNDPVTADLTARSAPGTLSATGSIGHLFFF